MYKEPGNDFWEFAEGYMRLNDRQKAAVHRLFFWIFFKKAIQQPTLESVSTAAKTFWVMVVPDVWRPALMVVLALAFCVLWFVTLAQL